MSRCSWCSKCSAAWTGCISAADLFSCTVRSHTHDKPWQLLAVVGLGRGEAGRGGARRSSWTSYVTCSVFCWAPRTYLPPPSPPPRHARGLCSVLLQSTRCYNIFAMVTLCPPLTFWQKSLSNFCSHRAMKKFDNALLTVCSWKWRNLCVIDVDFIYSYCFTKLSMSQWRLGRICLKQYPRSIWELFRMCFVASWSFLSESFNDWDKYWPLFRGTSTVPTEMAYGFTCRSVTPQKQI